MVGIGRRMGKRRRRRGRMRTMRMRRRRKSVPNSRVRAIMSRVGFQAWVLGDLGAVVAVLPLASPVVIWRMRWTNWWGGWCWPPLIERQFVLLRTIESVAAPLVLVPGHRGCWVMAVVVGRPTIGRRAAGKHAVVLHRATASNSPVLLKNKR